MIMELRGTQKLASTLTLYHTIPSFNDHEKEGFLEHCGKRKKCW